MYQYKAKVTKVIDGDTFDAIVDLGFNVYTHVRFRLEGIDTPELKSKIEAERFHALAAKAELERLILNQDVILSSSKGDIKEAVYNRWQAAVSLPLDFGKDVATILKANGFEKKASYE